MGKTTRLVTKSAGETQEFFRQLSRKLRVGDVVGLVGELGAGKTMGVQAILETFGISGGESPTFVMVKPYRLDKPVRGIEAIVHVDAYRFDNLQDAFTTGLADVLQDKEALVLVEWADRIKEIMPKGTVWITLHHLGQDERAVTVKNI